jgi:prepilin-type N-terminal cleavage/methylation domain-containing protein
MFRTTRPAAIRRAFTLAELTIVTLIIAIMAAVAVPRYGNASQRFQADAAARRIKADLEYLRQQARRSSATKAVTFDLVHHKYTMSGVADLDHSGRVFEVRLTRFPFEARITAAACGGDAVLSFDGFGVPDSSATISVSAGPHQRTVTVEAGTGKVTLL